MKVYDIPSRGILVERSVPSEVISKLQKVQQQYSTHQPCQRHAKVLVQVHIFCPSLASSRIPACNLEESYSAGHTRNVDCNS